MSYESPIQILARKVSADIEGEVVNYVQSLEIKVDEDELVRALNYDKRMYEKGYADAKAEQITCINCKFQYTEGENVTANYCLLAHNLAMPDEWYCADAERKEE